MAAVFPGQGSQHPGMGKFLYDEFSLVRALFEEASDAIHLDFKKLIFEGSESDLALTENTQPCLLLISTASFRMLKSEYNFSPVAAAGHSVGEYAACVASGALDFSKGIQAVRVRGQAMQSAVPLGEGGMAAVMGLTPDQVGKVTQWVEENSKLTPLEAANFNAPGQIVISGNLKAIQWLAKNFDPKVLGQEKMRMKVIPLKVSAPFHCSMMQPAQEKMEMVLKDIPFQSPLFPVVQNVHGQAVQDPQELRANLVKQVSQSVQWVQCVETLKNLEATKMIECGSGQVLAGLSKKIDSERIQTFNMNSLEEFKALGEIIPT